MKKYFLILLCIFLAIVTISILFAKADLNFARDSQKPEITVDKLPFNIFSNQLTIKGKVSEQDIVFGYAINQLIVRVPEDLIIVDYDKNGNFAFTIDLVKGYNIIDIYGLNKDEDSAWAIVEVYCATKISLEIGKNVATVNNFSSLLESPPYLKNSKVIMVPIRFITEQLGLVVEYFPVNREIKMVYNEYTIWLIVGKKEAWIHEIGQVGDTKYNLETPSEIKNGRTFVPLKFISETFDYFVSYDSKTQVLTLTNQAKE